LKESSILIHIIYVKLLFIILFTIGIGLLIYIGIKLNNVYKYFRNYLIKIGDVETLKKVERLNPLGERKFDSLIIILKLPDILSKKSEETRDNNYLLYYSKYKQLEKLITILVIFLFILFIFYMIIFF